MPGQRPREVLVLVERASNPSGREAVVTQHKAHTFNVQCPKCTWGTAASGHDGLVQDGGSVFEAVKRHLVTRHQASADEATAAARKLCAAALAASPQD